MVVGDPSGGYEIKFIVKEFIYEAGDPLHRIGSVGVGCAHQVGVHRGEACFVGASIALRGLIYHNRAIFGGNTGCVVGGAVVNHEDPVDHFRNGTENGGEPLLFIVGGDHQTNGHFPVH